MKKEANNKPDQDFKTPKGRFREIVSVILKHGLLKGVTPTKIRLIAEDLGPTFIKFGQILSTRPDIIPVSYCSELAKLRVDVSPMAESELDCIIMEEYGIGSSRIFSSFNKIPLGSASIAQVHKAILKDGTVAAVKVQRFGIRKIMARDIKLLRRGAKLLKITKIGEFIDVDNVLDELWASALQETDFLMEAKNADEFKKANFNIAFFDCPEVVFRYTTSKILVMRYIDGIEIDNNDDLIAAGYDLNEIAFKLADNYIKQVIDDGFFHADPHSGNLRIVDGKIVWLDLGMMGHLSPRDKEFLKQGVKAVAKGDIGKIEEIILKMSPHTAPVDKEKFRGDIGALFDKYGQMEIGDMNLGLILGEIAAVAGKYHLAMPGGFFLLGRGLLNLNGVLVGLSPEINLTQIIANHMSSAYLKDFDIQKSVKSAAKWLALSGRKSVEIPSRLADFLQNCNTGLLKINLKVGHADESLKTIDKIMDRFIKAIFASSLFVGGCMLVLSKTGPKIGDIHILGWIAFILSFIIGINTLWGMRKR